MVINGKTYNFYVISDLKNDIFFTKRFSEFEEAVNAFSALDGSAGKMPAMGLEGSAGSIDLMHKVNGDNVLVKDYLNVERFSKELQTIRGDIEKFAQKLIDDGVAGFRYCHSIVPWRDYSGKIVVPVVPEFVPDTYCNDKILKAGDGISATAINEILVDGVGWVKYKDFLSDPLKYAENGAVKVEMVNVAYVKSEKLVGIDGQMDLSVDNFEYMADKINKPYYISVSDIEHGRFERSNFAVASFEDLPSAVKAWYEINDKTEFTPGVIDKKSGTCVFNGIDDNFEVIPYVKAAEIYGIDKVGDIDMLINKAFEDSRNIGAEGKIKNDIELDKNL